ncbi:hydrogenase accessory protein [Rhodospirillum rubrum]|uniref:HypC/HybG/HupF family hydrogenase formation chaperone n=1 Tax=Rhodospirillum rubrum TaxID=1085 RepID=UPI0019033C78|nr:HypC/HybG/HupF family hydrogenase formation chaperone [Rhodospirillum rubrum]MBK1664271.1 hydrogenase accessory protein [Rhodospirillum rubrum]MBK1675934.1 hydrogenase accessory protein [Rhodospirillum rubrum]
MCIGYPMRIEALNPDASFGLARRAPGERLERIDLRLVGPVGEGQWVLVFLGTARSLLDDGEAARLTDALAALDAVVRGETVDHLFADLTSREPELPAFLRPVAPAPPVAKPGGAAAKILKLVN